MFWEKAFEQANAVRRGFARLLDDSPDRIAVGTQHARARRAIAVGPVL